MRIHSSITQVSKNLRALAATIFIASTILLPGCGNGEGDDVLLASGFIEGKEIIISSEMGGPVLEVLVDEGDEVGVDQVLVRLDDALIQTQLGEALAAVAAAEANLARIQAGARPEELAAGRAALAQAQIQLDGSVRAVENAQQTLENPQELNAQIVEAQTQVALAEQDVEMARADLGEAELMYNLYDDQGGDVERSWALTVQSARAAVEAAEAGLDGTIRYLNILYAVRANPLELEAQLHASEAQQAVMEAMVMQAEAALDELEAGPTSEQLAMAEAQLHQAEAAAGLIEAQQALLTLTSPISGIVTSRSAHPGENALPGITLLTLANLDEVTLVIYVPENRIGQIRVGQPVEVRVDSFPGEVFVGRVATIANEAEFTPRNVQTQEERVNLVFAVKVVIPNPDYLLKPGMPADAEINP
jgi:multidrug resistance efflux pump